MAHYRKCHPKPAGSETLCMRGSFMRENREISWPLVGWSSESHGQGQGRNPMMYDHEKSDGPVVPANHRNKAPQRVADGGEERGPAKGNLRQQNTHRTQCRERVYSALTRVRQVADPQRLASEPEAGAECGSSARSDLRGGSQSGRVPLWDSYRNPPAPLPLTAAKSTKNRHLPSPFRAQRTTRRTAVRLTRSGIRGCIAYPRVGVVLVSR